MNAWKSRACVPDACKYRIYPRSNHQKIIPRNSEGFLLFFREFYFFWNLLKGKTKGEVFDFPLLGIYIIESRKECQSSIYFFDDDKRMSFYMVEICSLFNDVSTSCLKLCTTYVSSIGFFVLSDTSWDGFYLSLELFCRKFCTSEYSVCTVSDDDDVPPVFAQSINMVVYLRCF